MLEAGNIDDAFFDLEGYYDEIDGPADLGLSGPPNKKISFFADDGSERFFRIDDIAVFAAKRSLRASTDRDSSAKSTKTQVGDPPRKGKAPVGSG
jgi:hypothetical protein